MASPLLRRGGDGVFSEFYKRTDHISNPGELYEQKIAP